MSDDEGWDALDTVLGFKVHVDDVITCPQCHESSPANSDDERQGWARFSGSYWGTRCPKCRCLFLAAGAEYTMPQFRVDHADGTSTVAEELSTPDTLASTTPRNRFLADLNAILDKLIASSK